MSPRNTGQPFHFALIAVGLLCALTPFPAAARPPTDAEFTAAARLGEDIAMWVNDTQVPHEDPGEKPPVDIDEGWGRGLQSIKEVAIFSIQAYAPFDGEYANVLETEILKELKNLGVDKVTLCTECRTPQVRIEGNEVVIHKGAADKQEVQKIGKRLGVRTLLVTEVYRTETQVIAQATIYAGNDGSVVAAKRFEREAVDILRDDNPTQLLMTFGSGFPLSDGAGDGGFTAAGNIQLAEEMGFARGGLNVGLVSSNGNTLIHVDPTLSFHGRFGSSTLGWVWNVGAGYGFQSGAKGFTARSSVELLLGSWAALGADGVYFIPSGDDLPAGGLNGYIGFHIGLVIGR